ncbi:MAG: UDP-N-acetylmuramoyl-L-alanyl-D-glutamate--2,6-diaminopimelate ligase [Spirochaetales bacterium]|nr:UDP-N-acetylmuramoyl-L-alanyl-D-glutamate--2,6-diaminopimelate ligase [Spirochaetales bacterium]
MQLAQLLERTGEKVESHGSLQGQVEDISDDSRNLGPGSLFVATAQGSPYLALAAEQKPLALVVPPALRDQALSFRNKNENTNVLVAEDILRFQGKLVTEWLGHPDRGLYLVGITGTNGKTSVSFMLEDIWQRSGILCGRIGTLGVSFAGREGRFAEKTGYTTPRLPQLCKLLQKMQAEGVTHVAMEVSSEALILGRVSGLTFSAAVFTNLSADHLDVHATMENYLEAKLLLLDQSRCLVVDPDSPYASAFIQKAQILQIPVRKTSGLALPFSVPIGFMQSNALLAVLGSGLDPDAVLTAMQGLPAVPGRASWVAVPGREELQGMVDYAHTPAALESILLELRRSSFQKIGTVFGCGGNRDRLKRPIMGEVAGRLSDFVIITDDNPRSEDPRHIRQEIRQGCKSANVKEIADRRMAIREGVHWLLEQNQKSVLLVAGKGHEEEQILADRRLPFSDREEFLRALKDIGI